MRKTPSRAIFENFLGRAAGALLLLTSLSVLIGCQGVSAGGGSGQKQASTLSLSLVTSTLDFGSVAAGSSKTLTITATNSGPDSVTVSSAAISTQYFALVSPSLPVSVAAGQSATISIVFTPECRRGLQRDALYQQRCIEFRHEHFADWNRNRNLGRPTHTQSAGRRFRQRDRGNQIIADGNRHQCRWIKRQYLAGFRQRCGISAYRNQPSPDAQPSQSTTLVVSFAPQSSGNASGTLTITSDASNSSLTSSLSGTGISLGTLGSIQQVSTLAA